MKTKLFLLLMVVGLQGAFANAVVTDPVAPILNTLTYCDTNSDGIGVFDLTTQTPIILAAQTGLASNYTVLYYFSSMLTMPVTNPSAVTNTSNPQQMYYLVTNNSTNTSAIGQLTLLVNPSPNASSPPDLYMCDTNNDGIELFNLSAQVPIVLGALNSLNYTVNFYTSASNAEAGVSPIVSIFNYTVTNNETIWCRVASNDTGCYDIVTFHLYVSGTIIAPTPLAVCDSDPNPNDQYTTFDLTIKNYEITQGGAGYTVTYYPNFPITGSSVPIANPTSYVNVQPSIQTLGVKVTSPLGCQNYTTLDIRVYAVPLLIPPTAPYAICDNDQDGIGSFDLTSLIPDLIQGSATSVTFYETMIDAQVGGNPITSPYVNINPFSQVVYARGENPITGCSTFIPIDLQVNPAPIAPAVPSIQACDMDTNTQNGITSVDLTFQTPIILATQPMESSTNYIVSYYSSQIAAVTGSPVIVNPTNYTCSNGDIIWYRVEANATGCYAVGSFQIVINTAPLTMQPSYPPYVLFDYGNDGTETFDLTSQINNILMGQTGMVVTFYPSYSNALTNTNAIVSPSAYVNAPNNVQTLGIRVTNSTFCLSVSTMDIKVDSNVPAPVGSFDQTFTSGATLADLVVTGSAIQWYASAANKNATAVPLPLNTILVDGTTYYASQTINGIESVSRLPVTVHLALGVNHTEKLLLQYAPNPVKNVLALTSTEVLKTIVVYTLLGQKIDEFTCNDTAVMVDLSRLSSGNYIVKVMADRGQRVIRISKE